MFKRRYVTMLETLIALGITMIILSTLMFFYREIDAINGQVEKMQDQGFRMRYVENRLATILPTALSETAKDFYFFSTSSTIAQAMAGSPTLVFAYNNGVKLDKPFSNHVLGRLFLDKEGNLSLATWPSPERWVEGSNPPMKKELLLEGIQELKFSFFVAPDRNWQLAKSAEPKATEPENSEQTERKTEKPVESTPPQLKPSPEGQWIPNWSSDFKQLPAMVKIEMLSKKGPAYTFVFPMPNCQRQVVFKR